MADNFKYAQLQPFAVSGAGAVIGDTSLILKSMEDIDGNLVTMTAFFGTIGFGTLEPGNGALEEQISFTGVTQNSNGTATLTGVSSVSFEYPYTATPGLLKTHAGSVPFIISNTSGFYDNLLAKNDDETITGTFTFPSTDPSRAGIGSDTDTAVATAFVTLGQLSRQAISGASNASTTVKGIVQLPTQAQVDAKTTTGSTGALLVLTPDKQRSTLLSDYVIDTGAADAYVITPVPAISAYTVGQVFSFKAVHTNTTTSTINVNGVGAKTIKKGIGSTNLGAGDITTGQLVLIEYDGTNFQMLSQPAGNQLPSNTGSINKFLTTLDGATISYGYPFDYQLFTGSGTWTKPSNLSGNEMVLVQTWGAGGGGGGSSTDASGGGGGGGGSYVEFQYRASDLSSTETVTIGAGGAASTAGGNTTFGSHITAYGGGAGAVGATSTARAGAGGAGMLAKGADAATTTQGAGGGPLGGSSNGQDGNMGGGAGGTTANGGKSGYGGGGGAGTNSTDGGAGGGSVYGGGGGAAGGSSTAGTGGTSVFGGAGGAGGAGNTAGSAGVAPAGGGGGGGRSNGGTATAGGAGARGEIRVWTFL